MGNNNSVINITFDRTQPAIYYGGETISGQVAFTIPKRTENINDIYLSITGEVGYTTVRTTRMQNGQTERITDEHKIRILSEKIILCKGGSTQEECSNKAINDRTVLEAGEYTYPFAYHLPDVLPPTLHPVGYPFVRYELELYMDKKWYVGDTRYAYPLRIYPRINLSQINNAERAVRFGTKRNEITIRGFIQRSSLLPGEETMLSLEVDNPNHQSIKRIDVCIIQRYEIEHNRRRLELTRSSVPNLCNISHHHGEATCPVIIPIGIPPTYDFKSKSGHPRIHVSVFYDLKLEVKVKGLFSDFDLQVPIIIGTDSANRSSHMSSTQTSSIPLNYDEMSMVELKVYNDDDIPLVFNDSEHSEHKDSA